MSLFADNHAFRTRNILFRVSEEERQYLRDLAKRRGIKLTQLIRLFIRQGLQKDFRDQ